MGRVVGRELAVGCELAAGWLALGRCVGLEVLAAAGRTLGGRA